MRVPVYQQQVAPQIPSVRTQVSVPDGAAGVAVKPIDTTAGIAQGVESLRLGLVKMQENRDKFMLASAVNEYRRSNTEFLHAKDTGVFAKKGKDVFGISLQYDEFSSKTMEDIAKRYKMSGAARDRFVEATSALYNASLSSVMTHEQRETDAAQQQEWKAMASDTLSNIALCYADDNAFNENVQFGLSAISQQWEPYGDQVRDSKMREYLSQCQAQRVAAMLEESPKAAGAYLEKHKGDFAGDDYLKVKKAVDNKLDVIKVQETTDALVGRFRDERSMLAWIHKNYEGEMENKMITAARARWTERQMGIASQERAERAAHRANFDALVKEYWSQGKAVPASVLEAKILKGELSESYINRALSRNRILSQRNGVENYLEGQHPGPDGFRSWSEQKQLAAIGEKMGVSEEARTECRAALHEAILNGTATEDIVAQLYEGAYLTKTEKTQATYIIRTLPTMQKNHARAYLNDTQTELSKLGVSKTARDSCKAAINSRASYLDPKSDTYVDDYEEIVADESAKTLADSGSLNAFFGLGWRNDRGKYFDKLQSDKKAAEHGKTSRALAEGLLKNISAAAASKTPDPKQEKQDEAVKADIDSALSAKKK